jgi:hypothetical protein
VPETPKPKRMDWRDFAERQFWTFVATAGANLTGAAFMDLAPWKAAALVGIASVVQSVTTVARTRLAILPNPGEGFGG